MYIHIHWTSAHIDEARRVAHFLVQERLVACANIIPSVESIFLWEGKVDTAQEIKIIFKTAAKNFEAVKKVIMENASYEVPEILQTPITGGNKEYFDWIDEVAGVDVGS